MQHLQSISQLNRLQLESLIEKALQFKSLKSFVKHENKVCATLFYENSTRTRLSFELAAQRLGMNCLNLDIETSSVNKGETLKDTVQTLEAMGCDYLIVRHGKRGVIKQVVNCVGENTHVINAGEGRNSHPTQTLLDLMTIYQYKGQFEALKVVIMGDVLHSRVANSLQQGLKLLGVEQVIQVAPKLWQSHGEGYSSMTEQCDDALNQADVIVCLRVQNERINEHESLDLDSFKRQFQLTPERLSLAKPDAIVMHPGPVNRDVEIASGIVDCEQSVILEQVANGVFMRMAVLDTLL